MDSFMVAFEILWKNGRFLIVIMFKKESSEHKLYKRDTTQIGNSSESPKTWNTTM